MAWNKYPDMKPKDEQKVLVLIWGTEVFPATYLESTEREKAWFIPEIDCISVDVSFSGRTSASRARFEGDVEYWMPHPCLPGEHVSESYKLDEYKIGKKWCEYWKNYWLKTQAELRTCETCGDDRLPECPYCGPDGVDRHGDSEKTCKHCGGTHELPASPRPISAEDVDAANDKIVNLVRSSSMGHDLRKAREALDRIAAKEK